MIVRHHTDLLNYLVAKHKLQSYLELGVQNPANNFLKINCDYKVGVDPEVLHAKIIPDTSDSFFYNNPESKFDLIFIDGLHTAEQVKKDFENSLKCLSDKGFILIHDCLPTDEITTCVPRGEQKIWFGSVFKFAMHICGYDGVDFITYDFDCGCMVINKNISSKGIKCISEITWDFYQKNKRHLMNIQDNLVS